MPQRRLPRGAPPQRSNRPTRWLRSVDSVEEATRAQARFRRPSRASAAAQSKLTDAQAKRRRQRAQADRVEQLADAEKEKRRRASQQVLTTDSQPRSMSPRSHYASAVTSVCRRDGDSTRRQLRAARRRPAPRPAGIDVGGNENRRRPRAKPQQPCDRGMGTTASSVGAPPSGDHLEAKKPSAPRNSRREDRG